MLDIITQHWVVVYLVGYLAYSAYNAITFSTIDKDELIASLFWPITFLSLISLLDKENNHHALHILKSFTLAIFIGCVSAYGYDELTLSPEDELAREKALLAEEKRELEEEHAQAIAEAQERVREEAARQERQAREARERRTQEIKDARTRIEIAKVQAERAKLRNQAVPQEVTDQIAQAHRQLEELQTAPSYSARGSDELAQANAELARLRAEGVDYSKLSQPKMSSASPSTPREPGAPVDEQRRLVLSGLWLGACFFLQRVFEKLFKDKGYALLTVCAAGFLLAFFTANYFLLGGSVTGGLMGAAGDRT